MSQTSNLSSTKLLKTLPSIPAKAKLPANATTEVFIKSPWYMRIGNLVIPLSILGPGIFALLIALGVSPLISIGAVSLICVGALTAIGWFGPVIYNWLHKSSSDSHPFNPNLMELKRRNFVPSPIRSLDWTIRITIAATAFALLSVLIALFALNPAGAIVGTSVLELIQFNMIPLAIVGMSGAVFGTVVGVVWQEFALQIALRKASRDKDGVILDSELKSTQQELQRRWYLRSKHDEPLPFRMAFGALMGVSLASFISLALLSGGGLGAPLFALIALSCIGIAIVSPFLGLGIEKLFAIKRELVIAENVENKEVKTGPDRHARFWMNKSTLDVSWYIRLFIGIASGLAIGNLFGGSALLIAPIVLASLTLFSPLIFAALEWPCIKLDRNGILTKISILDWLKSEKGIFSPTPHGHSTLDMPWYGRLFNGAAAGAALCVASLALGAPSFIAVGIGLALPLIAWGSPFLSSVIRHYSPNWLTEVFSPKYQQHHVELNEAFKEVFVELDINGTKTQLPKLEENKLLAYGQWYVRMAIGAMVGGAIGLGFSAGMGLAVSPLAVPLAVIITAAFFWLAQPAYKGCRALYNARKQRSLGKIQPSKPAPADIVDPSQALADLQEQNRQIEEAEQQIAQLAAARSVSNSTTASKDYSGLKLIDNSAAESQKATTAQPTRKGYSISALVTSFSRLFSQTTNPADGCSTEHSTPALAPPASNQQPDDPDAAFYRSGASS